MELKSYLSKLLLLSKLKPMEELFLYLVVSPSVVSVVLIREKDGPSFLCIILGMQWSLQKQGT